MTKSGNSYCFYFYSLVLLALITSTTAFSQSDHKHRMEGDRNYQEEDFKAAEESYRKSLEEKSNPKGRYNLGNAIYQQSRYDEAIKQYLEAADRAATDPLKADAYHNLGNAYYNNQDFKNSIESYKNALRINPQDQATKQNLALAQRQLLQQQRQQQQQQQQEQENQEDNQEQNEQQQQQQQKEQQQQENQSDQENQNEQQQEQQEQKPLEQKDLSKEEAEKLLEIMETEEQKVQEKLRKGKRKKTKSSKDW